MVSPTKKSSKNGSQGKLIIILLSVLGLVSLSFFQKQQQQLSGSSSYLPTNTEGGDDEYDNDNDNAPDPPKGTRQTRKEETKKQVKSTETVTPVAHQQRTVEESSTPPQSTQRDFFEIGRKTGTDKVAGPGAMKHCVGDPTKCFREAVQPKCRMGSVHW
jgi:hypothetical protein